MYLHGIWYRLIKGGGGGGGGRGLRYDFGSTPLRIWREHRKTCFFFIFILSVTPLYITLEVLQNTNVYIVYIGYSPLMTPFVCVQLLVIFCLQLTSFINL